MSTTNKSNRKKRKTRHRSASKSRSKSDRSASMNSTDGSAMSTASMIVRHKTSKTTLFQCRPAAQSNCSSMSVDDHSGPHIHPPVRASMESSLCTEDVQSSPSTKSSSHSSSDSSFQSPHFSHSVSDDHASTGTVTTTSVNVTTQSVSSFLNPLSFSVLKHSYQYLKGLANLGRSLFGSSNLSHNTRPLKANRFSLKKCAKSVRSNRSSERRKASISNKSSSLPPVATGSASTQQVERRHHSCKPPTSLLLHHFRRPLSIQYRADRTARPNRWPIITLQAGHLLGNRYLLNRILGKGSFAFVIQAKDIKTRKNVAIKVFTKINHKSNAESETLILQKIQRIEESDRHKSGPSSLVRLLHHFNFDDQWFLVFEHLSLNLYGYLSKTNFKPFEMTAIGEIAAQMCAAIAYLKKRNLIHTDIKPENVVFVRPPIRKSNNQWRLNTNEIKLIDLGLARSAEDTGIGTVTTRFYRAPEVILRHEWSFEIDVWSVACTLFELYNGQPLFAFTRSNLEHIYMMTCMLEPFPVSMRYNRPEYFKVIDRRVRTLAKQAYETLDSLKRGVAGDNLFFDLLHEMLQLEPEKRITAKEALLHSFVQKYCEDKRFVRT
jgi:hypothetical protein